MENRAMPDPSAFENLNFEATINSELFIIRPQEIFPIREPDRKLHDNAIVYDQAGFNVLLSTLKPENSTTAIEREKGLKAVRFVLTQAHALRFGANGEPDRNTPAHQQLCKDSVITAGEIHVDSANRIKIINNKSGDYHPHKDSLAFALIKLRKEGFQFADKLFLEYRGYPQGHQFQLITITRETLFAHLDRFENAFARFKPKARRLLQGILNQPQELQDNKPCVGVGKFTLSAPPTPRKVHPSKRARHF